MSRILKVHAPHLAGLPAGDAQGDAQVLVYDADRASGCRMVGFFPFTDELQKLFAVQGHPPFIYIEAALPRLGGGLDIMRVVTQERFKEKR